MLSCATLDLDRVEEEISRQGDIVVRATSQERHAELVRLQMLREMREILKDAYRLRIESADLLRNLSDYPKP